MYQLNKCCKSLRLIRQLSLRNYNTTGNITNKTPLYDFHIENNGRMVDFAGYLLPVQYNNLSIVNSHLHTRKEASIFDVSHMLQTYVHGKNAVECIEEICTADIKGLADNSGTLTVFTADNGGILDDLIVTKINSKLLYIVSNASRKLIDKQNIENSVKRYQNIGKDVSVNFLETNEQALIALQGPKSVLGLQEICDQKLSDLYFMNTTLANVAGVADCRITRCGYTGEDGVEISIPAEKSIHIVNALLNSKKADIKLAGLGARDSLRLEAGLCLYGNDIDETTKPVEAALAWLVAKRRRIEANFPGASAILQQLKSGQCSRRRVGIKMTKGPPARHGVEIFSNEKLIGHITSGCPSPSLDGNVGMGYVLDEYKKVGNKIELKIRDKFYVAEIVKMPFIMTKYYSKQK